MITHAAPETEGSSMTQTATGAEEIEELDGDTEFAEVGEFGAPLTVAPEPEYHEVSDSDYRFIVQKQNDLLMFGWAIQNTKPSFYQGTVPARTVRRRRAIGKLARAARKLSRLRKRGKTGGVKITRTKHAH